MGITRAALLVSLTLLGCNGSSVFTCEQSDQCRQPGSLGTCEADGFCSFPDLGCPSGRRYGDLAGDGQAGECVPEGSDTESASTSTTMDPGSTDPGPSGSESSTAGLTGAVDTTSTSGIGSSDGSVSSSDGGSQLPSDGLLLWYGFQDPGFPGAEDMSGNGRHALCDPGLCPTFVPGPVGAAAQFNGVDQEVELADHPDIRFQRGFSASLWLRLDEYANNARIAWGKAWQQGGLNSYEIYLTGSSNQLRFNMDAATVGSVDTDGKFPLGQWFHVVGTYDGDRMRLYLDGRMIDETLDVGSPEYDENPLRVGGDTVGGMPSNHWPGSIDEVRVYDRELTFEEVQLLFEEGST